MVSGNQNIYRDAINLYFEPVFWLGGLLKKSLSMSYRGLLKFARNAFKILLLDEVFKRNTQEESEEELQPHKIDHQALKNFFESVPDSYSKEELEIIKTSLGEKESQKFDPLLSKSVIIVSNHHLITPSILASELGIGHERAEKILTQLTDTGILSRDIQMENVRKVLIPSKKELPKLSRE